MTKSDSFNALGVLASATTGTSQVTGGSAAIATATTITYNATNNLYTISTPLPSQPGSPLTFFIGGRPDPTEGQQFSSACGHDTGACSSTLVTVTHTGHAGFVYSYAASLSATNAAATFDATQQLFNAAVFGIPTPATAIPVSGSASYALDLYGQEFIPTGRGNQFGSVLSGSGTAAIDFAAGTFSMSGTGNAPMQGGSATSTFSASGRLASGANAFSGSFSFADAGDFKGSLNGWFFGPQAQELGAVFAASQADGRIAAGTILGHKP